MTEKRSSGYLRLLAWTPLGFLLSLGPSAAAQIGSAEEPAEPMPESGKVLSETASITPGDTYYVDFPELGKTWHGRPTRLGIYFPTDYSPDRRFPLLAWFGGGAGTDSPKRPAAITGGAGYVCLALPYRSDEDGQPGGWQTPWSYYRTMLDRFQKLVPNIDSDRRASGGYSSGGAAVMYQIGNSDGAFQAYFHAFIPGGAGWPMGGLETIKGRPMFAFMGEDDKRLPNYRKLEEEAGAEGVDFTLCILEGTGHKFSPACFPEIRRWLERELAPR